MGNSFGIGTPKSITFNKVVNSSFAEKLIQGFDEFHFISFVTSLKSLVQLFNVNNFRQVYGVIGSYATDQFKTELKNDMDQVSLIQQKIKSEEWLLYIRKKGLFPIHDKFYLLKNNELIRVMIGSANLTPSGLYGRGQKNILLVLDYELPLSKENHGAVDAYYKYLSDSKSDCELFMQDLSVLLEKQKDDPQSQEKIIKRWLNESNEEYKEKEASKFIKQLNDLALEHISDEHKSFSIDLPDNKDVQTRIEKYLPPTFFEKKSDNKIIVTGHNFFKLMKESAQYPLMYIKKEEQKSIYVYIDTLYKRTFQPDNPQEVNDALKNLEDFCNTVDLGKTEDPLRAKMIFYEAMLYFLNAPFSHELMKIKKETVGYADDSGLKYLFICGPGSNSKTQLIRFMLKVLSGQLIDPLPVEKFNSKKVDYISRIGTIFPIVADDIKYEKFGAREDLLKNYWEKHWNHDNDCPQLIVTTNYRDILNKEWASRRIKGLDFEVMFKKNQENSQNLNRIMMKANPIFTYFSYYFLNVINTQEHFRIEDELNVARKVMKELYRYANRELPRFFPDKPVEERYDKNLEKWRKSIKLNKVQVKYRNGSVQLIFKSDMMPDIKSYLKALPHDLIAEAHGDMIISENGRGFKNWLNQGNSKRPLLQRVQSLFRWN